MTAAPPPPAAASPVIGVVGGIGAGKSAATAALARRGGRTIDADALGHEALELPAVKARLVERWGPAVLKADGTANRRAIAGVVFADPAELRALEALVYPHIGRRVAEEIAKGRADPAVPFLILDAAVMLEAGWAGACDKLVFVDAPRPVRVARVAARSGWSDADLAAREAAQLPLDEKKAMADAVLTNDGPPDALQFQVDGMLAEWGLLSPA